MRQRDKRRKGKQKVENERKRERANLLSLFFFSVQLSRYKHFTHITEYLHIHICAYYIYLSHIYFTDYTYLYSLTKKSYFYYRVTKQ